MGPLTVAVKPVGLFDTSSVPPPASSWMPRVAARLTEVDVVNVAAPLFMVTVGAPLLLTMPPLRTMGLPSIIQPVTLY